jgi:ATP-dependent helicase/nuclease subunit B
MDSSLSKLISDGATVLTPTQRLSRHIRYQFATDQIAQGKQAWKTPDCLPWEAWCKRSFESLSFRSKDNQILLNNLQQQWLWQEIISHSKYKDQLLQITATAKQAAQAYQLAKEWCVPIFPKEIYLSEDAYAFKYWAGSYEKQKQKNDWLDDASLPDYIATHINELKPVLNKIVFYDFDRLTTQQIKLKEALLNAGIQVEEINAVDQNESANISQYTDNQSEIISAALWAKQHLENDQNTTIGIIAPNLSAIRDKIEYGFASVLTPQKWLDPNESIHKPYSISLGKSLSTYPLIHTALNLLSLGKRKVSINVLSALLHSPFITGATEEEATRAKFDAALRRIGEQQLSLKTLYWIAEERCEEYEQCKEFIQLLKTFEISFLSHARKQTLRLWTTTFSEWLTGFGWPGERSLDSDEHQVMTAWQSALTQLGSLDGLSKPVSFSTALFQLNRLLTETRFQPETPETPIQISGIAGAAGMQFDYLWVMGMQDDNWPALMPVNAFIPITCQREFHIPTASADAQLELAKNITDKLIMSAKEVVFSYSSQEGDRLCRPSPLIKNLAIKEGNDGSYEDYKNTIFASSEIEVFIDINAPEIPAGQTANGGSSLFKDQSGCPFKAFARHRLYAEGLQQTDIGLSAAERGNLVHRALQYLWQRLKSLENLKYKTELELEEIIHSVVSEAIKLQISQQPETFTDRFTELEQQRLEQLLKQWLLIESERGEFKVIATEEWKTILFEDIELHLRVDRVDELADGRCVILDYKTGPVSKSDWESENPNDPQLPLYAVTNEQQVAAIAFASLKRGELRFIGQAESDDILPKVKSDTDLSWQEKLDNWEQTLIKLANDFRQGIAIVDPKKSGKPSLKACRYCDLHALCRIHERIESMDDEELTYV